MEFQLTGKQAVRSDAFVGKVVEYFKRGVERFLMAVSDVVLNEHTAEQDILSAPRDFKVAVGTVGKSAVAVR